MKKIKTTVVENGFEKEVEIEVPDGPPVSWGDPKLMRVLNKHVPRLDGPDKVTGKAKYTYDINLPGMLYGRLLTCPYAAARIPAGGVDLSGAQAIKGVVAMTLGSENGRTYRYAGEFVAAVAAPTPEIADDALRAIQVKYEPLPYAVNPDKARSGPPVLGNEPNLSPRGRRNVGDVEKGFASCTATVEGTYTVQTRLHCCLETHGHVCKWDGDQLTVWASTQAVHGTRADFADQLGRSGMKPSQVRVITEHMGGGFGSKFGPGAEGIACAILAKKANAPVKLMLTRWDEQLSGFNGPGARATIKAGANSDGRILAWDSKMEMFGGIGGGGNSSQGGPYIYTAESVHAEAADLHTNTGPACALRAPGHPQGAAITEAVMDDLAAKLGMDPLEFRRKNLKGNPLAALYNDQWTLGAQKIGWERRNKTPGAGIGVKKRGIGMASGTWGGGGGGGAQVDVAIHRDGSVEVMNGTQDLGTGTRTYVAMIVAEELGLDVHEVTPRIGDSMYGNSPGSGGSTTCASVAPAVKMAAVDAREKLLAALAPSMGAPIDQLEVVDHRIQVKGNPNKAITWKQACARLGMSGIRAHGEWNQDLRQGGVGGCQFAEVEVDTETGKVQVLKVVAVQDAGLIMNRLTAESQVVGGIVQGVAQALLERRHTDDLTGRVLNPNLEEYKLTGSMETPAVEIYLFDTHNKVTGIGEPAVIPTGAAIANAVFNAIGVRVAELPITPDLVLQALGRVQGGNA
jgi:xanthine dehydrogenase YagR molybdenum-binding subunit